MFPVFLSFLQLFSNKGKNFSFCKHLFLTIKNKCAKIKVRKTFVLF